MATVTGMTAAAMNAIRDGMVVSAAFDSANRLILTKHDGTQVDGGTLGAATTTLAGPVELATNAETQSGSATNLAVTPAGLASLPGYRVQIVSGIAESATPASWPYGVSMQSVASADAWSLNSSSGTVVTYSVVSDRTYQTFYGSAGGTLPVKTWTRSYHTTSGGGGWTPWQLIDVINNLTPANFTQTTALANYPLGWSRLYYTSSNSTGWDFNGSYGEVMTYRDGTDYAKQIWTKHSNGGSTAGETWFRTANGTNSWSPWWKPLLDPGAWSLWTPTWVTTSGLATPSLGNAVVDCRYTKRGRKVECKFEITFGSTTNFGSGATSTDNWKFGLPVPAARGGDTVGFLDMYQSATANSLGRAKTTGTDGFTINIIAGSTANIGGDVDSTQPFAWAANNYVKGLLIYESAS